MKVKWSLSFECRDIAGQKLLARRFFIWTNRARSRCAPAPLSKTVEALLHPPFTFCFRDTGDHFVVVSIHSHNSFTLIARFSIASESSSWFRLINSLVAQYGYARWQVKHLVPQWEGSVTRSVLSSCMFSLKWVLFLCFILCQLIK